VKFKCRSLHFFETSFGRIYSRRILLVSVEPMACAAGVSVSPGKTRITAGMDGDRLAYDQALSGSAPDAGRIGCGPGLRGALCAGARPSHVQSGPGKRGLGREARQKQIPLWKLLGGTRREIACGVSIGIQDSPEQLLGKIETELAAGYRRIKIKVKPGWDLNVLETIRARWADIVLSVDANSAYTLDEIEHLRKFDAFNLLMIEQPLWNDEIYLHSRLQKSLRTAICLDEIDFERARCRFCAGDWRLQDHQHQGGPRGRL